VKVKYEVVWNGETVDKMEINEQPLRITKEIVATFPTCVWKVLATMKVKERSLCELSLETYLEHETNEKVRERLDILKQKLPDGNLPLIKIAIEVLWLHKIDDIQFDGSLLKKTLRKGNSTARPEDTSVVYYALEWLAADGSTIKQDEGFTLEEEELDKLEQLSQVRRNYFDEYSISKMLKRILYRTKPL